MVLDELSRPITQALFAELVGVSEAKVSQLVGDGVLERGQTGHEWLLAYCFRLREQAAGRMSGEIGGLDLVQERAALAREQRLSIEIKNAIARGEYAPIGLLADVLAAASQGVSDRFEALPGTLRKACPDLPDAAREQIDAAIAQARNEWVRSTSALVAERFETTDDDETEVGAIEVVDA